MLRKLLLAISLILFIGEVYSQSYYNRRYQQKFVVQAGSGTASYFGDVVDDYVFTINGNFTAGMLWRFHNHIALDANLTWFRLAAEDAKSDVNDVLFDYDRYNIREDARPALNAAASYLNKKREIHIVIEGHSDERGTNEYNLALGEKRAIATMNYLRSLGVSPSRVHTVSYGEEKPICTISMESCWQRNRRSSIKLSDLD